MAAEGMPFPRRWYGGMISANLEVIWEMSDNTCFLVDAPGLRFAIGYCVRSAPALALGNRLLISATRSDTFLTSRVDLPNGP